MSFKNYALTAVFAAAVGAGGTVVAVDRYIDNKMQKGQPCDVYKDVTKWMDRHAAKDAKGESVSAVNYSEEQIGEAKVCSVTAGSGQDKDVAEFIHKFKGLFR